MQHHLSQYCTILALRAPTLALCNFLPREAAPVNISVSDIREWPQLPLRTFSIFLQLLIPAERLTEQILRAQAARVSQAGRDIQAGFELVSIELLPSNSFLVNMFCRLHISPHLTRPGETWSSLPRLAPPCLAATWAAPPDLLACSPLPPRGSPSPCLEEGRGHAGPPTVRTTH